MVISKRMVDDRTVYVFIGGKIAARRKALKMTQARLAEAVSLSRVSISNIEKGRQNFLVHTLWNIARVMGVHAADLLPRPAANKEQLAITADLISHSKLPAKDKKFVAEIMQGTTLNQGKEVPNVSTTPAK
jgi:transcriptional regulator with XRE-family HTH domain